MYVITISKKGGEMNLKESKEVLCEVYREKKGKEKMI